MAESDVEKRDAKAVNRLGVVVVLELNNYLIE
jgi:hypothetical protein